MSHTTENIRKVRVRAGLALADGKIDQSFYRDVTEATDGGVEWYLPAINRALDEVGA